ncbi:3-hydroxyacyl-ACP dehydratase FabZ [Blattabacterium cuenoti]|uniref:3-hydroxyacyl-ACP dehydratase FabZ n=1 Tax=Blattabacterium cuenoti TaxID=1653831 RepID=UPI00163BD91D|nr:3-hydroxyacyl-ACP dehydratase FabZ [Blattabacterium cuenoti]
MFEKQKTIAGKISLQGFGLYTENKITITFKPAPEHTGFIFIRTDIKEKLCISAHFSFLSKKRIGQGIVLEKNGVKIYKVEHILAALTGMDLDNIIIELDNTEIPIMDGSSKLFVEAIEKIGVIEQNAKKKYNSIKEVISYGNKKTGSIIIAFPSKKFEIMTIIDFDSKLIDTQNAVLKNISQFKEKISGSKTFCVLRDRQPKNNVSSKNIEHQESNEIAKHFLLDIIGFLTLTGAQLKGKLIFYNTDNYIIMQFLKKLFKKVKIFRKNDIAKFNLSSQPILDIKKIMKILPHKPPFLMVDKIIDLTENTITGVKNVTMNESFFIGHFPNEPIMPGVLQIEAIAQVGGILILSKFKNPELYSTYFLKIDKVKFKRKIVPGDIIIFQVYLLESMKRGIVHMQGIGYVNNKLVVEAEVMAKIVKNHDES